MIRCCSAKQLRDGIRRYLQSGFVRGGVVGKPTTVRQTLDHLGAKKHSKSLIYRHAKKMLTSLAV